MSSIPVKCNDAGLGLIMRFEGCKLQSYLCPASVWTIGYGHTGDDVKEGMVINQAGAERFLMSDLKKFCKGVGEAVMVDLNENQFSALVCLVFNIGLYAFKNSTLLAMLNSENYLGAAAQFDRWNKAGGKVLEGLCKRREAERMLFET